MLDWVVALGLLAATSGTPAQAAVSGSPAQAAAAVSGSPAQAAVSGERARAAMRCAPASILGGGAAPNLQTVSHYLYYAMEAANADPGGKPFMERLGELAASAGSEIPDPAKVAPILAECDKRFPLARVASNPVLPSDPFKRDVMCLGVLSLLSGAAEEQAKESGDRAVMTAIAAALRPVQARLTDDLLESKGLNDEVKFGVVMGEQIKASIPLGNPESVGRACGVKGG